MAITDLRTLIASGESITNWTDAGGSAAGSVNTDTMPPGGAASISDKISNSTDGLVYNTTATGNFAAGDHLYMWYNFMFGALDTVAGDGIRFRVCGATITDWAEITIDGSDSGRSGWRLAVMSLDEILSNPDATNGTPPTAANVQRVGIICDVTAIVGGNNDNLAVHAIYRHPSSIAGAYRIDAGTDVAPNTWQDIADQCLTDATGVVVKERNGAFTLNGPMVFGPATGVVDMTFEDSNVVLAWNNNEFVEADFYHLTMDLPVSYTGDARITAGVKLGTGETAVGVAGWTVVVGGPRYAMNFDDADQTAVEFYGCSFNGSALWSVDDPAVEIISCLFADCDTMEVTGGASGPTVLSNFFAAAPGPGPQIDLLANPSNGQFDFNAFANMTDFAIEISENGPVSYDLRGITYSGNGANGDIEFTHASGLVTVNISEGGDTPGVTQTGAGTNEIVNAVTTTVQGVTEGSTILMIATETVGDVTAGDTISGMSGQADESGELTASSHNYEGDLDVRTTVRNAGLLNASVQEDGAVFTDKLSGANSSTADTMDLFADSAAATGDKHYFGCIEEFEELVIQVTTAGTGTYTLTWEYWNGAWTSLSVSAAASADLKTLGREKISFTAPSDWAATAVTNDGTSTNLYYIRATVATTNPTITPDGQWAVVGPLANRYLPFKQDGTITSDGLIVTAVWVRDSISRT